ncbi:hypothetical protein K503DRAFT_294951 [Rhizopogon vinicolor AM-OR11-026]|uniref:Uncharacterized protein n=1 Tax=Rhizopogon vinicolor AM-OR11-026 TaxID=1314800 RepID=A0A1B7MV90_9AGAM|nr:hypothetical protein K503DRAFT_294951 [Rhizopogon vinicolor AM-OR11-026]
MCAAKFFNPESSFIATRAAQLCRSKRNDLSTYIRSLDSNHLVGLGDEGWFNWSNSTNYTYGCADSKPSTQENLFAYLRGTLATASTKLSFAVRLRKPSAADKDKSRHEFRLTALPRRLCSSTSGTQLTGSPRTKVQLSGGL